MAPVRLLFYPPLLSLCLLLLSVAGLTGGVPICSCNHGVVVEEAPQCRCVCFRKYLLPHCLYSANDMVAMELWLINILGGSVNETLPLSSADVITGLSDAFSRDPSDGTFLFLRAKTVFGFSRQDREHHGWGQFTVVATVSMPGWAAQHLLADVMNQNTAGYVMRNSLSGVLYAISAVFDDTTGPQLPLQYRDGSLAFYSSINGTWFVVVSNLGWLCCAGLVVLLLQGIERSCMYNVWWNTTAVLVRHTPFSARSLPTRKGTGDESKALPCSNKRRGVKFGIWSSYTMLRRRKRIPIFECSEKDLAEMQKRYKRRWKKVLGGMRVEVNTDKARKEGNPLVSPPDAVVREGNHFSEVKCSPCESACGD